MTTGKVVLVTVLAGIISVGLAILGQQWLGDGSELRLPIRLSGPADDRLDRLPDFSLPDVAGQDASSADWTGKVVVLNFWATWCPPCLREMPLFAEAQERYAASGLQTVGIAIDETEDVKAFLAEHPVNYPILLGDTTAIEMSRRLGNRLQGLPFTVIFDRAGKRVHAQAGEITSAALDKKLAPLLSP